jgi:hypothetical protein
MQGNVQRIALDGAVVELTERGARALADAYWAEVRRVTVGLVRPRRTAGGIELRFAGVVLFRFGAPQTMADDRRAEVRFPIAGGLLAKEEGGSLTFVQRVDPSPEIEVSVEDYVPFLSSDRQRRSLRRFAYRQVQERAHTAIGRRYLERMAARSR